MKKRFWACFLSLSLVLTMMPTMAFATDETVDEPADTSEVCTVTDGCTLQTGHEGDCVVTEPEQKEPESMPCTLTQGCTLEADHEGECVTAESMTELPTAAINSTTENDGAGIKQSSLSGYCGGDTTANSDSYPYDEDKTQYVYDNLTWQLTENGSNTYTLSITGNGVMANWAYIAGGIRNAVISSPWSEYSDKITEIDLNGNIQLGDRAFQGLSALTAFDFPEGITKIPTYAFADCVSLENITIPDTVTEIGTAAFRACDAFTSISIPESVTTYGEHLFYSCHNLQDVQLPSNLENLPGYMFRDCVALEEITFPDGLTSIGIGAFEGCTSLKYLELSSGLKSIDASAFKNCTNLEDVDLSNTQLEEIPENLFQGISKLKSVKLPDTVKKIGSHAFADTGITQLMLPPQVDWIYGYALDGCSNIIAVTMVTEPFEEYEDTASGAGEEYWERIGSQLFLDIAENSIVYLVGDKIPLAFTGTYYNNRIDGNKTSLALTNGGTFAEDTVFESGKLTKPTKVGYLFAGWYTMDGTDGEWGELAETISEGKTYYAKWTPSTYKVTEDLDFDEVVYGSTASQVIEVSGSDGAGTLKVADNDIFETVINKDNTITVTPRSNLSVGEYEETLYVTTPDGATFFVPVTLKVVRAGSELAIWANGAENLSLSGGGNVTLTITGDLNTDEVTVTCNNENIEVTENADDTYTVTLPNEKANYTFTATYDGDQNHKAAQDSCTVSVTRHTGGGGASHPEASDDSSSNRNDRDDDDTENIDEEDVPLTEGKVADFDDVPADAWFAEAVQYVYEHDLMTGVSENLFAPNAQMNRAMVAQILFNMEQPTDTEAPAAFRDVAADQWYAKAVNWAVWQGYMSGYDASSFGPNDALTREQLVTVLWRYSGSPVMDNSSMLNTFSDAALTSDYAQQAMIWAYAQGVISGNADGTLNPQGTATRAEIAQMLMNYCENVK